MAKQEVQRVIVQMQGIHLLMARMLYGCGLRLMECIRLRIMDLYFERNVIYVRAAKGGKDRTTLFHKSIREELRQQVELGKRLNIFVQGEEFLFGALDTIVSSSFFSYHYET